MTSEIKTTTGVFGRITAWWHGLFETVPPELAQCEFECRERNCDAEKFDGCLDRLCIPGKIRGAGASRLCRASQLRRPAVARMTTNITGALSSVWLTEIIAALAN
ncbi:MAG: hypothetical protein IPK78_08285 [Rhodospirillales bacterium]|nr:hypothetical protein [Rhodospirillales bacterium]